MLKKLFTWKKKEDPIAPAREVKVTNLQTGATEVVDMTVFSTYQRIMSDSKYFVHY